MPILDANEFFLRALVAADAAAVVEAIRESVASVGVWMPWATPTYSKIEAAIWIEACAASRAAGTAHEFGIFNKSDGLLVGAAGLNQFNQLHNFCNLGYWVRETAQRRGAASSATKTLCSFAFNELRFTRVEIVALVGNGASAAVARRAGATLECIARNRLQFRGEPHDAYVYSIIPASGA
jgi:RimJ/RimL family protein N-acetyltransferase